MVYAELEREEAMRRIDLPGMPVQVYRSYKIYPHNYHVDSSELVDVTRLRTDTDVFTLVPRRSVFRIRLPYSKSPRSQFLYHSVDVPVKERIKQ